MRIVQYWLERLPPKQWYVLRFFRGPNASVEISYTPLKQVLSITSHAFAFGMLCACYRVHLLLGCYARAIGCICLWDVMCVLHRCFCLWDVVRVLCGCICLRDAMHYGSYRPYICWGVGRAAFLSVSSPMVGLDKGFCTLSLKLKSQFTGKYIISPLWVAGKPHALPLKKTHQIIIWIRYGNNFSRTRPI